MSILDGIQLPDTSDGAAIRGYLLAQENKDFSNSAKFFAEDIYFNGLVLNIRGRESVAAEMNAFLPALTHLSVENVSRVEADGDRNRYLILYGFKVGAQKSPQPLCDHVIVVKGKITRVDNAFDVKKLPPMG